MKLPKIFAKRAILWNHHPLHVLISLYHIVKAKKQLPFESNVITTTGFFFQKKKPLPPLISTCNKCCVLIKLKVSTLVFIICISFVPSTFRNYSQTPLLSLPDQFSQKALFSTVNLFKANFLNFHSLKIKFKDLNN